MTIKLRLQAFLRQMDVIAETEIVHNSAHDVEFIRAAAKGVMQILDTDVELAEAFDAYRKECEWAKPYLHKIPELGTAYDWLFGQTLFCCLKNLSQLGTLPQGIKVLICAGNDLTILPALPIGLLALDCSDNEITELPELPAGLVEFDCGHNQLKTLPTYLPTGLKMFKCNGNRKLVALPLMPGHLEILNFSECAITKLQTLPTTLISLLCGDNRLTILPQLPKNLIKLYCPNNQLGELPNLPSRLEELHCAGNPLRNFPEQLPGSLKRLIR